MRPFLLGFFVAIVAMIAALGSWRLAHHQPFFPARIHSARHLPPTVSQGSQPHSAPPKKSSRLATATPTPKEIATAIIPNKRMATAQLFNGIDFHATLETAKGSTTVATRDNPASYELRMNLKVAVPHANAELASLTTFNPFLPTVLPSLTAMLAKSRVSPFFDELYRFKVERVERSLTRLDDLLSRHNFYDCETVLDLEAPTTKRHAILIQTDMDVDMDGSDGDRIAPTGTWTNFQPTTSYRWRKKTDFPNPYLADAEQKLARALQHSGTSRTANREAASLRDLIYQLKKYSFLIGATDPYVVLPVAMITRSQPPYKPSIGDYCVVIYKNMLYPAIVGDAGPSFKAGEASLRICREISPSATPYNRPVEDPKITYLVFPGTAEKPFGTPNLEHWRARCEQLLNELGGYKGTLFTWTDLTKPVPTPTPLPTPTPTPSSTPKASPTPLTTGSASSPTPTPAAASSPLASSVRPSPSAK